ncbi:hypothetical protein SEA_DEXES_79 [Mycobacterium phage Dexes]|nr:hypothetical protein SEA_DEXES_79 [Mycobacterium phage Dexes]
MDDGQVGPVGPAGLVEEIRRKLIARLQEIVNDLSGDRDYMGGMDRGLQEALNIVEGRDYWDDGD